MARDLQLTIRIGGELAASYRATIAAARDGLAGLGRSGREQAAVMAAAARGRAGQLAATALSAKAAGTAATGMARRSLPAMAAAAGTAALATRSALTGMAQGAVTTENAVAALSARTGLLPGVTARVGNAWRANLSPQENVLQGLSAGTELLQIKQKALHDYLKRDDVSGLKRSRAEAAMRSIMAMQQKIRSNEEALNRAIDRGNALSERRNRLYGDMGRLSMQGAALLAPAGLAVKAAAEKQDTIRDIAITGDIGKEDEAKLSRDVREIAAQSNQLQSDILQGMQVLVAGGIQEREELARYGAVLGQAATATRASMDDLGATTLALRDNLGITASELGAAFNILASAGKAGNVELKDMAKFFPQIAPSMASMGIRGKEAAAEMAAALEVARRGAGSNDEAATNMRNFLQKIFAPDTVKNFADAGIDLKASLLQLQKDGVGPFEASMRLVMEYLRSKSPAAAAEFQKAMQTKDEQERAQALQRINEAYALSDLFRDMQAMNFLRPMMMQFDEYKKIKNEALQAAENDVLGQDFKKRMETPVEQAKRLRVQLEAAQESLGNALLPSALALADTFLPLLQRSAQWIQRNQETVAMVAKVAVGLLAFRFGLTGLRLGFNLFLSPLARAATRLVMFRALTGAGIGPVRALLQAFGMSPRMIGLFTGGLGGAGGKAARLTSRMRGLAVMLGGVFSRGLSRGAAVAGTLGRSTLYLGRTLGGMLVRGLTMAGRALAVLGRAMLFNPIGLLVTGIAAGAYLVYRNWDAIKATFQQGWNWLKRLGARFPAWGKNVLASICPPYAAYRVYQNWGSIRAGFQQGWNWLRSLGPRLAAWGREKMAAIFPADMGAMFAARWEGVKSRFNSGWNWFKGLGPRFLAWGRELAASIFPGDAGTAVAHGWSIVKAGFATGISWLKGLPAQFLAMGRNIVDGLINGLKNGVAAAGKAISDLASSVKNKFTGMLGINSPSRVFAGLGLYIAEGAAQGIRNGMAQARSAAAGLAAQTRAGWGRPTLDAPLRRTQAEQANVYRARGGDALPHPKALPQPRQNPFMRMPFQNSMQPAMPLRQTPALKQRAQRLTLAPRLNIRVDNPSIPGITRQETGWTPPDLLSAPDREDRMARAGRQSSGPVSVSFSPSVNIAGNADAAKVREGLSLTLPELERMLHRVLHDQERRAYV